MVPGEAEDLLQEPNYELTQEDLDELIQSSTDVEKKEKETNVNQLTPESCADLFKDFRNLKHKICELNPSMERSMKIGRELEHALAPYTMLFNEMEEKKKRSL
jgi:hypothetical protein